MIKIRTHIGLVLIAVLTLTGHSMAIARGASGPAGFMELCTGAGPIMVAVDEHGVPTGESHICPEFSLLLQVPFAEDVATGTVVDYSAADLAIAVNVSAVHLAQPAPVARGPPDLV